MNHSLKSKIYTICTFALSFSISLVTASLILYTIASALEGTAKFEYAVYLAILLPIQAFIIYRRINTLTELTD